ncbi:hypothetical protein [Pedobacter flavus]|uniref:Uncharacterized protein n=1 Tax=Pedobacter flavus TaxID=3113906 RepID=A0ABU7H189_9SPHI|nr:hypothetical protein [Pedobacter sp. VNH31]MEE1885054.1 hypothetical protein [Pedobacter sp. VNH31]
MRIIQQKKNSVAALPQTAFSERKLFKSTFFLTVFLEGRIAGYRGILVSISG